jgi:hypothetical protein
VTEADAVTMRPNVADDDVGKVLACLGTDAEFNNVLGADVF